MPELLTMQDLDNGHLDVVSLEKFINGSDSETVLTRLSARYPTIQKALKELFENGGIAARFKTVEQLQVEGVDLSDGDFALVADDTDASNGVYIKDGGQWVKSKYDFKSYIKNKILNFFSANNYSDAIIGIVDSHDTPIIVVDKDGSIRIFDLEDTLQESLKKSLATADKYTDLQAQDGSIATVLDAMGLPVAKIVSDGGLQLQGLEESVQDYLKLFDEVKTEVSEVNHSAFLFLTDAASNVVLMLDGNGELHLKDIDGSMQENIRYLLNENKNISEKVQNEIAPLLESSKKQATYDKSYKLSSKNTFTQTSIGLINKARSTYPSVSPAPNLSLPQPFNISDTWVNDVRLTVQDPRDFVKMAGFDPVFRESIGVVHPNVWSFNDRVAGYKYWLSINPYTNGNENIELPFIYGSNDPEFRDWHLIEGFPAPFEADPVTESGSYRGHLSDAALTYDPLTGDIVYFWRKTLYWDENSSGGKRSDSIYMAARYNGVAWSDTYALVPTGASLSPAILFNPNDNLFYLYEGAGRGVYYRTAPNLNGGGWSDRQKCNLSHQDGKVWHLDAKYIGNQVVLLIHGDNFMSNPVEGDVFYFGVSSDFINFNVSPQSIMTNTDPQIYKASFEPVWIDDTQAKFRIVYTSDSRTNPQYQLYVTDTNTVNLGVTQ